MMKAQRKIEELEVERLKLVEKQQKSRLSLLLMAFVPWILGAALFGLPGFFGGLVLGGAAAGLTYWTHVGEPYKMLKYKAREFLLREFMNTYHPDISYRFYPSKKDVRRIVKSSKLITANQFREEDVIIGNYKDSQFYLSEIHLKMKSDKSSRTVFKGILFQFTIPGKSLPRTRIQSKPELLKRMFSGFVENKEYGFWMESDDPTTLTDEFEPLLPFIRHLAKNEKDLRLRIEGNQVTMLLGSKMKFLDDPKPTLSSTFDNPLYFQNIGKQLNSLLYILHAFVDNLETTEIEERLELLHLPDFELIEKYSDDAPSLEQS